MDSFIRFIDSALPDKKGGDILYKFKRKKLDEMNARVAEIKSRGLANQKVIEDLVISENANVAEEYNAYYASETATRNAKKNLILNLVGSAIYLLLVVVLFLGVSFATKQWAMTWAIMVDGVLLWVVYLLSIGVRKFTSMKRIFHIFARMFLAGSVIVFMVSVYLAVVALTDLNHSWLIVIVGLIAMLLSDALYATAAHHRLVLFNWLLYIPAIAAFLLIIIGVLGIMPWSVAWLIVPAGLIVDLAIIMLAIAKNKMNRMEVADVWKEN